MTEAIETDNGVRDNDGKQPEDVTAEELAALLADDEGE